MILVSFLCFFEAKLSYIISLSNNRLRVNEVTSCKANNTVK